jgi:hypothetical protein
MSDFFIFLMIVFLSSQLNSGEMEEISEQLLVPNVRAGSSSRREFLTGCQHCHLSEPTSF